MEIKLSSNPDYHPIMQADPCVSSNAPSLGASGEPGHPCWRDGLFYKMLKMGIGGNFIKVLQSMYSQTKYAVKVDNRISEPFLSSVGVKQCCVLSPLLFNLYLSDLPCIFDNSCDPVSVNALSLLVICWRLSSPFRVIAGPECMY